jgi:hypothetical protein
LGKSVGYSNTTFARSARAAERRTYEAETALETKRRTYEAQKKFLMEKAQLGADLVQGEIKENARAAECRMLHAAECSVRAAERREQRNRREEREERSKILEALQRKAELLGKRNEKVGEDSAIRHEKGTGSSSTSDSGDEAERAGLLAEDRPGKRSPRSRKTAMHYIKSAERKTAERSQSRASRLGFVERKKPESPKVKGRGL